MIPTVGFNMRKITKGNVTIKVRAEGCRGPCVFGRATEAPGKSQPGRAEWHPVAGQLREENRRTGSWRAGQEGNQEGEKEACPTG